MLKFPINLSVWIFTILLLIIPVIKTERYIINSIDLLTCNYDNDNHRRACESLKNSNYLFVRFTHVLQDFISVLVNGTYIYDSLSYKAHTNRIDHRWRRRRLCAISDTKYYSTERFLDKIPSNVDKSGTEEKRTLLDFDGPILMNDIDDPDSLKAHVRVKRTEFESDSLPSFPVQQDYLKDLANSFPRDNYESIDENSYDDDASFDKKREIKSHEYFANDEVPAYLSKDESLISTPSDVSKANTAVELVREKRNDYKSASNVPPSRSTLANLKVDLLRMRRKAKDNRYEKKSKLKKKKKHAGKVRHSSGNHLRSVKDVRSRMSRARGDGKSIVEIDNVVAKDNNNSFRRRFVKSTKLLDKVDSGHGGTKRNEKLKSASENKVNTDTLNNHWLPAAGNTRSDENINAVVTLSKKEESSVDNKRSTRDAKLRTKRDKHAVSNHGFSNEQEELRYYQNIREPGSEMDECIDENESQLSVGGNRAVRSIEEVKELAKKLVTKVNELQNYLNIEEAGNEKQEKKIETRAIDDLCSNVSAGCYAFKDASNVVQKCVPTNRVEPKAKIVERKVGPVKITDEQKVVRAANKNVEKKRSVGSRRVVKMSPSVTKVVRKQVETKSGRKWGKWTDWSSCSVTCGKGRQIRWRYCLRDCSTAETEMEEKACQLPACPPGKFLGIF